MGFSATSNMEQYANQIPSTKWAIIQKASALADKLASLTPEELVSVTEKLGEIVDIQETLEEIKNLKFEFEFISTAQTPYVRSEGSTVYIGLPIGEKGDAGKDAEQVALKLYYEGETGNLYYRNVLAREVDDEEDGGITPSVPAVNNLWGYTGIVKDWLKIINRALTGEDGNWHNQSYSYTYNGNAEVGVRCAYGVLAEVFPQSLREIDGHTFVAVSLITEYSQTSHIVHILEFDENDELVSDKPIDTYAAFGTDMWHSMTWSDQFLIAKYEGRLALFYAHNDDSAIYIDTEENFYPTTNPDDESNHFQLRLCGNDVIRNLYLDTGEGKWLVVGKTDNTTLFATTSGEGDDKKAFRFVVNDPPMDNTAPQFIGKYFRCNVHTSLYEQEDTLFVFALTDNMYLLFSSGHYNSLDACFLLDATKLNKFVQIPIPPLRTDHNRLTPYHATADTLKFVSRNIAYPTVIGGIETVPLESVEIDISQYVAHLAKL